MSVSRRSLLSASALGLAVSAVAGVAGLGNPRASAAPTLDLPVTATNGVSRCQVFDFNLTDKSVYQGQVAYTWGAKFLTPQPPETIPSYYLFAQWADTRKVEYGADQYTLAWFEQNHPEWIVYRSDRTTVATYSGVPYVPWDITNQAARDWYYTAFITPAIADGWTSVSLDMHMAYNMNARAGHFDTNGAWVTRWTGEFSDQQYVDDIVDYTDYLVGRLHADGISVAANIYMPEEPSAVVLDGSAVLASMVDIVLEEGGVVNNRNSWLPAGQNGMGDQLWRQRFDYYRTALAQGKAVAVIEFGSVGALVSWPEGEVDYAIATYFLYKEAGAMLWLGTDYGNWTDRTEMHADIGTPQAEAVQLSSGVWRRDYSSGLVLVNPSTSATETVPLPDGDFVDTRGTFYQGSATMAPTTGLTLRRTDGTAAGFTVKMVTDGNTKQAVRAQVRTAGGRTGVRASVTADGEVIAAAAFGPSGQTQLNLGRLSAGAHQVTFEVQWDDGSSTATRRAVTIR